MATAGDQQIACRFVTKLQQEFRVPTTEIAVPASLTRYGLSQVINHLLGLEEAVPFDFLVNSELVRVNLGKLLLSQNLSTESVLKVEYFLAVTPPQEQQDLPHDDWVSAVDGQNPDIILSGCYDGLIRVWNGKGELYGSVNAHKGPISAVYSLPSEDALRVLSSGKLDHVIRLLSVPQNAVESSQTLAVYKGHGGSVLDLAASPSEDRFISASQDKTLRIWPADVPSNSDANQEPQPESKKKQKLENGSAAVVGATVRSHTGELSGHTDAVTSVAWSASQHLFSGSMDHSVRKWDAETATHTDTFNGRHAINCIALSPGQCEVVAFAGAAKSLFLWDPRRRQADDAGVKTFSSHSSHILAVAWHPISEHHLVTASIDKSVKLWDLRSSIPLHTLTGHTEQVLCAGWWGKNTVISGGADNSLKIFKTGGHLAEPRV